MEKNQTVSFSKGETPRNELVLPTLHFVVMDQWIDVIGEKALFAWLKMYTWTDRKKGNTNLVNLWEESKIPTSYNKVIKRLGVGKDTFYNKILKPLWNVGLIDIEEYEESDSKGNKPMNIIVYKHPQNNINLSHKELVATRDYDQDYHSQAKTFASQGGRPKRDGSQSEPSPGGGSQSEPPMVLNQNHPLFQNRTRDGSHIGHNNTLNSFSNIFNDLNNTLNSLTNNLNSSSKGQEEEEERINKFTVSFLEDELKYSSYIVQDIIKHMKQNNVYTFTAKQMQDQHERTIEWIQKNKKEIREFGFFFVNGILKHEPSTLLTAQNRKITVTTKGDTHQPFEPQKEPPVPFYNWLEN